MIEVTDIRLDVGRFVLGPLSLRVARGEQVCVLGPSGSGKSLLVELVAGFHRPAAGVVRLRGALVNTLPAEARGCAWVPQGQILFPHLSVRDNIEYGLAARGLDRHERRSHAAAMAERLGIAHLVAATPPTLSGGERQRVALARALVTRADVLLLDEPFSSVEPERREQLWDLVAGLQRELGLTVLQVTHDVRKVVAAGLRVVIMTAGRITHDGPPPPGGDLALTSL